MNLGDVFKGVEAEYRGIDPDIKIEYVTRDSRKGKPGMLFAAIPPVIESEKHRHGINYAAAAYAAGMTVMCDRDPGDIPHVRVSNAEEAFALVSANIFGNPAKELKLVGVTGTKGKTTTTHLIKTVLEAQGKNCGLIGTNDVLVGSGILELSERGWTTTPEPPELHGFFRKMADAGCEYVIMEVSSHALAMKRLHGLTFEVGAFTNLTLDHLDYHKTFDAYAAAKAKLFRQSKISAINDDAEYAGLMLASAAGDVVTYGVKKSDADIAAKNIKYLPGAVEFEALSTGRIQRMHLGIPGEFSVYNALTAVAVCSALGVDFAGIAEGLAGAEGVRGRLEIVDTGTDYTVMIDYAHTPDSLENVLRAVRKSTPGRIIAVFGCGGDRDRTKRPLMGGIAEKLADMCVVTSDNPRTEKPMDIINEILNGMAKEHTVIENRREAIAAALSAAREGDLVLVAGKGQETYQEIDGVKHDFDERVIIKEILGL